MEIEYVFIKIKCPKCDAKIDNFQIGISRQGDLVLIGYCPNCAGSFPKFDTFADLKAMLFGYNLPKFRLTQNDQKLLKISKIRIDPEDCMDKEIKQIAPPNNE